MGTHHPQDGPTDLFHELVEQLGPPLSPIYGDDAARTARNQAAVRDEASPAVPPGATVNQRPGGQPSTQIVTYDQRLAEEPIVTIMGKYPADRELALYHTVIGVALLHLREARKAIAQGHEPAPNNILVARFAPRAADHLANIQPPEDQAWYNVIKIDPWDLLYGLTPSQQANVLAAAVSGSDHARKYDVAAALLPICTQLARPTFAPELGTTVQLAPTPDILRK